MEKKRTKIFADDEVLDQHQNQEPWTMSGTTTAVASVG